MQAQTFVELDNFNDLARYVCSFREFPLRVYTHILNEKEVISTGMTLANSLVFFYTDLPKSGRYISYSLSEGKESASIVDNTKNISTYAPIIHLDSKISPLDSKNEIQDKFHAIKLKDLGSLARLTYDPQVPEDPNLALYLVPTKAKWVLGYITSLEMNDPLYIFNYVELDSMPTKPFLKNPGSEGKEPEFSNTFDHGIPYFPIIKIKENHSIFGLE